MNWQDFLYTRQAIIADGVIQRFTQPADLTQPVIADLSQLGVLQFSGEESFTFLQNQLSSDLREVNEQQAQYSSYSTPKGRMLASFLIWQYQQQYYLQLDPLLLPAIQKRLSMYILRSKTRAIDITDQWGKFGLAGNGAGSLLANTFNLHPKSREISHLSNSTLIIGLAEDRFEIVTPIANAPTLWQTLVNAGYTEVGDPIWQLSEIRALTPWITLATQDEFVPQMMNFDLMGGISFNKGCYPGQEIVARTHYLGKLKRRMFHASVATEQPVTAGMEVFSNQLPGQSVGKIVNAAPAEPGVYEVLLVVQTGILSHPLYLGNLDGPLLIIKNGPAEAAN